MVPDRKDSVLGQIGDWYRRSLESHGFDSRSVGWRDRESHHLRFAKLAGVMTNLPGSGGVSVGDWGCGYGELFRFLDRLLGDRLDSYVGCDISPDMIEAAGTYVSDERAVWRLGTDIERPVDYVFVSGTFNVRFETSDEHWEAYVLEQIQTLWAGARRGLAFNLLSTYVDYREDRLFYGDPAMFFDFCKRNLSRHVNLIHDYPLYEWTIQVHRVIDQDA